MVKLLLKKVAHSIPSLKWGKSLLVESADADGSREDQKPIALQVILNLRDNCL